MKPQVWFGGIEHERVIIARKRALLDREPDATGGLLPPPHRTHCDGSHRSQFHRSPLGVELATQASPTFERHVTDAQGYAWPTGAVMAAECLVTGKEMLVTPEHALHVIEIMSTARKASASGRRVDLTSTFKWPIAV